MIVLLPTTRMTVWYLDAKRLGVNGIRDGPYLSLCTCRYRNSLTHYIAPSYLEPLLTRAFRNRKRVLVLRSEET